MTNNSNGMENDVVKNTGSTEFQISRFTSKIEKLSRHFKENKHDYSAQRSLRKAQDMRRKLEKYKNRHLKKLEGEGKK